MTDIHQLIPHRKPMLLIDEVLELNEKESVSRIEINENASFYTLSKGVPSWIGVEYMGQTAAMIAGYQLLIGATKPHLGLLLGTRKFRAETNWFPDRSILKVSCRELAVVGDGLATFGCTIVNDENDQHYASAKLSVFRKPLTEELVHA